MCSATVSPSRRCLSHKVSNHAHYVLQLICCSSFCTIFSIQRGARRVLQQPHPPPPHPPPVHLIYSSKHRKQIASNPTPSHERAWYTLFVHALIFTLFCEKSIIGQWARMHFYDKLVPGLYLDKAWVRG